MSDIEKETETIIEDPELVKKEAQDLSKELLKDGEADEAENGDHEDEEPIEDEDGDHENEEPNENEDEDHEDKEPNEDEDHEDKGPNEDEDGNHKKEDNTSLEMEDTFIEEKDQPIDTETNDLEDDVLKLKKVKKDSLEDSISSPLKRKASVSNNEIDSTNNNDIDNANTNNEEDIDHNHSFEDEDEKSRKRREFEEKFAAIIKKPTKRRRNNDVDLEAMQDEAISHLKNLMKESAYLDIDCINNKKPATNKLRLLPKVKETLLKSNLYDSILDNNMLEAIRIWLEPLPDGSLPSFEIQKTLLNELIKLPIKTIHLRESGLGKVMLFYQKSKKVDSSLKRIAEKLIGDWTRPIMGRSDNYKAKWVPSINFDYEKYKNKSKFQNANESNASKTVKKSLYQESADRRKRAAAPEARNSVYTIAPQVNVNLLKSQKASISSMGIGSSLNRDERFKKLNQKLTSLSQKKRTTKKGGVSIEGRGLNM